VASDLIFSIMRVSVGLSDISCGSLVADGLIERLWSATISEACDKLFEARAWLSLPLISVLQIISIFSQCHEHGFIDHVRN
jgi:hypothetical protein